MTESRNRRRRTETALAGHLRLGIGESMGVLGSCLEGHLEAAAVAFHAVTGAVLAGGTVLICGNGGSAADAQHLAGELVGRFQADRHPIRAVALTSDAAVLTGIGNDYGYRHLFSRQVRALGRPGDVLLAISTSGMSPNVLDAVRAARELGVLTVALTGGTGGELPDLADHAVCVSGSARACRIQEALLVLGHLLCEWIERECSRNAPIASVSRQ